MAKKKKRITKERGRKPINISTKQYQEAIKKAGSPEVVKKLEKIYTASEERMSSDKARRLASRYSKGFLKTVFVPQTKIYAQGEKGQEIGRAHV